MEWNSEYEAHGSVSFPAFGSIRILMMPIDFGDLPFSLPGPLTAWLPTVREMLRFTQASGIGYLTIDEREVEAGACHRRPGLHVDGWHDDADDAEDRVFGGSWGGGGGGSWAGRGGPSRIGLLTVSSHEGCRVWAQTFNGEPKRYGDCEHLRVQCRAETSHVLKPHCVYGFTPLTVHAAEPSVVSCRRQFVRISMPSRAGWPSSCTPNPNGILPSGPIIGARPKAFCDYVPKGVL